MSYAMTGLGASVSASVSATTGVGPRKRSKPASTCTTAARKKAAEYLCKKVHIDCPVAALPLCPPCVTETVHAQAARFCKSQPPVLRDPWCAQAKKPVCGGAAEPSALVALFHPAVVAPMTPTPVASPAPPPVKPGVPTRPTKIPVQAATPVPIELAPEPPVEAGIPMWVWIAGGAAVLGTGAYLYSRRKAA